jgi:hypothetical protein
MTTPAFGALGEYIAFNWRDAEFYDGLDDGLSVRAPPHCIAHWQRGGDIVLWCAADLCHYQFVAYRGGFPGAPIWRCLDQSFNAH